MGSGHLKQRSPGSYSLVVYLGRDPETGKKRYHWETVRGTKRQAQHRLSTLLVEVGDGTFVPRTSQTLGEFLADYLREYAATNVRPETYRSYEWIVHKHLVPTIGAVKLSALRPYHVQGCYQQVLTGPRSDGRQGHPSRSTAAHIHRVLRAALEHAVRMGLISRNPAKSVVPPRPSQYEARVLNPDETERLIAAADRTGLGIFIRLALMTGLRRSELLGLRWRDVELGESPSVTVVQTLAQMKGGAYRFDQPKSKSSRRRVRLPVAMQLMLRQYREQSEASGLGGPDTLLFCDDAGEPWRVDALSRQFAQIRRAASLSGVRLHDLRHTHVSLLIQQGVHPKVISERIGHASVAFTLQTYGHLFPDMQEEAALAIGGIIDLGSWISKD